MELNPATRDLNNKSVSDLFLGDEPDPLEQRVNFPRQWFSGQLTGLVDN